MDHRRGAADQGRRVLVVAHHVHHVRGGVLLRDHARRHPVDLARPGGAGYALGFTYGQSMRYIVLPQAFRNMLPVLLTQTIILFQDISLVYVIGAPTSSARRDKIAQRDGRPVEMYLIVAVVYFIICFTLSCVVKMLQTRIAIIR